MISAWCLHLMDGLGRYVIWPGEIEQVLVMTNNLMTLGYNYAKCRINILTNIVYTLTNLVQIDTRNLSRLSWYLTLQGIYLSLNFLSP